MGGWKVHTGLLRDLIEEYLHACADVVVVMAGKAEVRGGAWAGLNYGRRVVVVGPWYGTVSWFAFLARWGGPTVDRGPWFGDAGSFF